MKKILLTIIITFGFIHAEEWIYFNNMTDYEFGVGADYSVSRISPDGSEFEIIMEDVAYSDLSEDGTKLLYIEYAQIEGVSWVGFEPVSFSIYNTETSETISSITGISPVYARFTHDENIVLYMEGSQYSNWQLYKYSFSDSSSTMLIDSLGTGFNITLSPNGQQVLYFKPAEDENTEDNYMDYEVIVSHIETGESTTLAIIPYYINVFGNNSIWSDNGFIYLNFLDDNNCAQLIGIHSSLGYITQLTDNPCTGEIGYYCVPSILNTKETDLDKFVYTTCSDSLMSNEHWIYDITSDESSYLGYFGGENYVSIAQGQTWSPDRSKVAFNEWLYTGMIIIPGYLRVYDTVTESIDTLGNVLDLDDPEAYYAAGPIHWIGESEVSIVEPSEMVPEQFVLYPNYPNPFNPTTQIKYDLPEDAMVSITIYDIMGRSIKSLVNSQQTAGYRSIQWNATNNLGEPVSAGMYIYMIQAGEFRQVRKMVLLK
jgi:hypothetical protein